MFYQKYIRFILFCLLVLNQNLFSQYIIEGIVTDTEKEPVHNALIELINQNDTSRVFSATTNEEGYYFVQIRNIENGSNDVIVQNPGTFNLLQNYPNPFNPTTVISYELPHPSYIRVEVHNILGQKIKTLYDGFQQDLFGQVTWDGTNDRGQGVSAGLYFSSLTASGIRINKKMLLIDGNSGYCVNTNSISMPPNAIYENNLHKENFTQYTICVSGNNIKTWEQKNLNITQDMVYNITVCQALNDIDGNCYSIVKIGDQCWMAENLRVTHYRNGDPIPNVTDNTLWANLSKGAYCCYVNNSNYAKEYGALYNWYAVSDIRNIAPEGWHVPTDDEWKELEMYLGMSQSEANGIFSRGTVEGCKLKEIGTTHWEGPNARATNESGFSARPGGCSGYYGFYLRYGYYFNRFNNMTKHAYFWTATEHPEYHQSWYRYLYSKSDKVGRYFNYKQDGFSVRLVRD